MAGWGVEDPVKADEEEWNPGPPAQIAGGAGGAEVKTVVNSGDDFFETPTDSFGGGDRYVFLICCCAVTVHCKSIIAFTDASYDSPRAPPGPCRKCNQEGHFANAW
ncbi:hypothetical protein ABW21_db0208464 [Orbilia brochopaga]|nr:hypothetical protein ABW21_db0208464 [Drechslerella brochopaga]